MTISEAPPVLAIQLKRFAMSFGMSFMSNNKITKPIQFPLQLSLPCTKQKQPVSYDLTGVVVHHGSTTHSGHYIAYVKAPNGIWYEMNDSSVSQVSVNRVLQAQAYLLFYSQKPKAVPPPSAVPPTVPATTATTAVAVPAGKEEKKAVETKPAVVKFDPLTVKEQDDLGAKTLKVPLTPAASKSMKNSSFHDDEDEESEMDSDIEDDMDVDGDYDGEEEEFPPLYCTHIFRYKSPLERFRRWYWTKRPNLYKDRAAALRKFTKYPSMRSTKMVLRKYLLVRQHIAGIFQQDTSSDEEDESEEENEEDAKDPDRNLFLRSKSSTGGGVSQQQETKKTPAVSSVGKQQMITEDDDSDEEEEEDDDDDSSDDQEEATEQDDMRSSTRDGNKFTVKQATMDDILDMSRRARTLGGEGVWEGVVSDKAKQKIDEISKQQRREDQIHRKQYRLSEWDQSLDAGHMRKVKEPKAPLQDNTGKNNPFQHVTEQRREDKRASLEAGEYEDFRGEVQKHQRPRPPQYKEHQDKARFNNHKKGFGNRPPHGGKRPDNGAFNKRKSFGKN